MPDSAEPDLTPSSAGPACPPTGCGCRSWLLWLLILGLVAVYFLSSRQTSQPAAFTWVEDLPAGLEQARQTGRPVFITFHATWCPPCQTMNREVFSRKDVADALAGWVPIHVDGDKDARATDRYRVNAFPTLIMLDPAGRETFRHEGYLPADQLIQALRALEKPPTSAPRP